MFRTTSSTLLDTIGNGETFQYTENNNGYCTDENHNLASIPSAYGGAMAPASRQSTFLVPLHTYPLYHNGGSIAQITGNITSMSSSHLPSMSDTLPKNIYHGTALSDRSLRNLMRETISSNDDGRDLGIELDFSHGVRH